MENAWAGGGDWEPQQQVMKQVPYRYQVPVEVKSSEVQRDPAYKVLDWAISVFGSGTVLLALAIGGTVLWRKFADKWLTKKP